MCKGWEVGACWPYERMMKARRSSPPGRRAWRRGALGPCPGVLTSLQSALLLSPFQQDNSSLLNDYVLGAQLGHEHVDNLMEPINISFWHNQSLVLRGRPRSHPVLPLEDCPGAHWFARLKPSRNQTAGPSWKQTFLNPSHFENSYQRNKREKLLLTALVRIL